MPAQIKKTADGSATIYIPELDEHYHSIHGAVQESMHVFIQMGLRAVEHKTVRILEMGFGTGLNTLLTLLNSQGFEKIVYTTIEKYPLKWEQVKAMEYEKTLQLSSQMAETFERIHTCPWEQQTEITSAFYLQKLNGSLRSYIPSSTFNLVYFDAFAPRVQPDLWSLDVFKKLFISMEPQGILTTYCAKGEVRRTLLAAGFAVERLPGPPGKREMLRAIKP